MAARKKKKPLIALHRVETTGGRIEPGSEVPADLPGLDDLIADGVVGEELPPAKIVAGDGGTSTEESIT